ncbi:hypothetical protein PsorP6_015542 [Peronosclerospora sorghi]|uniref:Uncharacterized protein n=1 Tax=Peronosclerospora sorghi TaxID=230839 RepID=A0ACC0WNU4_9STRA|nr:hypothetical protein PsorP6_015542 [Peronosclerospora sorghi]
MCSSSIATLVLAMILIPMFDSNAKFPIEDICFVSASTSFLEYSNLLRLLNDGFMSLSGGLENLPICRLLGRASGAVLTISSNRIRDDKSERMGWGRRCG